MPSKQNTSYFQDRTLIALCSALLLTGKLFYTFKLVCSNTCWFPHPNKHKTLISLIINDNLDLPDNEIIQVIRHFQGSQNWYHLILFPPRVQKALSKVLTAALTPTCTKARASTGASTWLSMVGISCPSIPRMKLGYHCKLGSIFPPCFNQQWNHQVSSHSLLGMYGATIRNFFLRIYYSYFWWCLHS